MILLAVLAAAIALVCLLLADIAFQLRNIAQHSAAAADHLRIIRQFELETIKAQQVLIAEAIHEPHWKRYES